MPQSYNTSALLGGGSATSPSSGMNFSSLIGSPTQSPNISSTNNYGISKQPGDWGSSTASQIQNLGTDLGVSGYQNLQVAASALGLPLNYYAALLSGNPQAAMQAEAPAVNSVLQQYDTARQNAANLQPRGGGSTQTQAQAPYQAAGTVASLLSQAQSNAASGITTAASSLGSLGTGETSQSSTNLNNILNYILGEQASSQEGQLVSNQTGQQIGTAIGQILPVLLQGLASGG